MPAAHNIFKIDIRTEGDLDYRLVTRQLILSQLRPLSEISLTLVNDSIAQENNETFQLQFDTIPSTSTGQIVEEPFVVQDTLSVTIIDSDGELYNS